MTKKLAEKVALVTGASRGIGYASAKALADEGAHIVALARTVGGLEELDDAIQRDGGSATLVPLDLNDMEAIDRLGAAVYERWGKLDILLSNAAVIGNMTPVSHIEPKVMDDIINVNIKATWRLLRAFDALLRQAPAGRALFMTSSAPREMRQHWATHTLAKTGMEAVALTYARETQHTAVKTILIDSGPVRTALRGREIPGENMDALPGPKEIAPDIVKLAMDDDVESGSLWDVPNQVFTRPGPF